MARLIYRPAALRDLASIYDLIAEQSPERALKFIQDVRARCRRTLPAQPESGRRRDDLGDGLRIFVLADRRIVVAYRVSSAGIEIERVFYGGADYEAILGRSGE